MDPEIQAMTPAQRMTKGFCPECGVDLSGQNPLGHRDYHYPRQQVTRGLTADAAVRFKMLTEYHAANQK